MTENLDITRDHCPMTFVKVKVALARLAPGDVLDVLLSGAEPLSNVPRSASEEGHEILSIEPAGEFHRILIRKRAAF